MVSSAFLPRQCRGHFIADTRFLVRARSSDTTGPPSMNRRRRLRNIAEQFVDGAFVEAVLVVRQIVADDDGTSFLEGAVDFFAAQGAQHVAYLFPVLGTVVGDFLCGEQA